MKGLIPFNRRKNALSTDFNDFYNVLDDFFSDNWPSRSLMQDTFKVDVKDNGSEYIIEADLPGIDKKNISIDFSDGRLTISVEQEENVEQEKKNYVHRERHFSSMSRSIYLADTCSEDVKAKLENGVLNLTIPKKEKIATSRKIEIE